MPQLLNKAIPAVLITASMGYAHFSAFLLPIWMVKSYLSKKRVIPVMVKMQVHL